MVGAPLVRAAGFLGRDAGGRRDPAAGRPRRVNSTGGGRVGGRGLPRRRRVSAESR